MSDHKHEQANRPEWVPKDAGSEFTTKVVRGIDPDQGGARTQKPSARRRKLGVEDYVQGIRQGNRTILARAITLIESNAEAHRQTAQQVLQQLLPDTGNSIRIGITGVPGVGKSTFIETFGLHLCKAEHQVAVLAVDPSSTVSGGSILGDKTRMSDLARHPQAFIRPSPSSGTLGGVARKTRETMLLCEAFGFDVILVETVGVGQSEVTVRSMVDFFLLLMLSGAGDELQGIKKGIIELADAMLVNKADGDNVLRAKSACKDYNRALHYLTPATAGWKAKAYTCSATTGDGIENIWQVIQQFQHQTKDTGIFQERRKKQAMDWVHSMIADHLNSWFYQNPVVKQEMPLIQKAITEGSLTPSLATERLIAAFTGNQNG